MRGGGRCGAMRERGTRRHGVDGWPHGLASWGRGTAAEELCGSEGWRGHSRAKHGSEEHGREEHGRAAATGGG